MIDQLGERSERGVVKAALAEPATWEELGYLAFRQRRDRWLDAVAAVVQRIGVPAAGVSLLGVCLAALVVGVLPARPLAAVALFLAALLCDCLDGAVARRAATSSPRGKLIDQLCDTATFGLVLVAVARSGLAPARAVAYALAVAPVLLALAIAFHSGAGTRRWRLTPRGGFFAHFPKAPPYLALLGFGLFGVDLMAAAVEAANLASTLLALGFAAAIGWRRVTAGYSPAAGSGAP